MLMTDSQTEQLVRSMTEHWSAANTSAHRLSMRVRRMSELLERAGQRHLERAGLTQMEFDVLSTLRKSAPPHEMRPSDLCRVMMASSGGMSIVLRKLQGRELVRMETALHDARSKLVRLETAGAALIEATMRGVVASEAEILRKALAEDDLTDLERTMSSLVARMDD